MNPDGGYQSRLTNNPDYDACYSCSPDSQKLACETFRDIIMQFYVINSDGSDNISLLMLKMCSVYGGRNGPPSGTKYFIQSLKTITCRQACTIMNEDGTGALKLDINESNAQSSSVRSNR